jgi:hypothetical protein
MSGRSTVGIVAVLAVLLSSGPAPSRALQISTPAAIQPGEIVIVARPGVRLMVGSQPIFELPRGTRLQVTQVQDDWIGAYVLLSTQQRPGWVQKSEVKKSADTEPDDPIALAALQRAGATVQLDDLGRAKKVTFDGTDVKDEQLPWLKTLGGLKGLFCCRTPLTDAGLVSLPGLHGLEVLDLRATKLGDAGLEHLGQLTGLKELWLSDTGVTDAGLARLKGLTGLTTLDLGGTKVTDAGLAQLRGLAKLESLWLNGAAITDAGLEQLGGLTDLQVLMLKSTRVTKAGIDKLKRALPNLVIDQ